MQTSFKTFNSCHSYFRAWNTYAKTVVLTTPITTTTASLYLPTYTFLLLQLQKCLLPLLFHTLLELCIAVKIPIKVILPTGKMSLKTPFLSSRQSRNREKNYNWSYSKFLTCLWLVLLLYLNTYIYIWSWHWHDANVTLMWWWYDTTLTLLWHCCDTTVTLVWNCDTNMTLKKW